jgi:hypothetical protein
MLRDISLRGGEVAGALSRWLDTNRPEALAKIKELGPRELQSVLQAQVFESGSLVNKLGKLDPDLLCGLLNQLTFSKGTEGIFSAAMDPGVCERAWGHLIQNQDFLDDEALRTLGFDLQSARDL